MSSDNISLFTDASGLGLGATYGRRWLYADWSKVSWVSPDQTHINTRELFAIWVAVRTWGHHWSDSQIIIHTDNEATVNVWKTGTCKDKKMMRIIRALFFFCAKINLNVMLEFIPGKVNINSDNLSRLQVDRFLQMNPSANRAPTSIPEEVWTIWGNFGPHLIPSKISFCFHPWHKIPSTRIGLASNNTFSFAVC